MKILFPLIKAGTGSDIFTYNLLSGLKNRSISADIQSLPKLSGYCLPLSSLYCNTKGYDLLCTNTWSGGVYKKDLPLVSIEHHVVHEKGFEKYKTNTQKIYHKFIFHRESNALKRSDSVVCVSRYTQKQLESVFGYSNSTVIYNGIDETLFKPDNNTEILNTKKIPDDKKLLFFAGNPSIRKGGDLLPKIMKNLGEDYLLLMTNGLGTHKFRPENNILPVGNVTKNELVSLYNISDLFLFPSRLEGFGLSVAEAMACAKPVVTTNCSSLPELVDDEKGGVLCEIDNVTDYADAIRYICEDDNLKKTMGRYNRRKVEEMFTITKMTDEYIKVFSNIIQ